MTDPVCTLNIVYPIEFFSLNKPIHSARGNRIANNALKQKVKSDLYYLIKSQIKEPLTGCYHVSLGWRITSKTSDLDNLLPKLVFDSLQDNGLLINDSVKYIKKITSSFEFVKKENQGVVVKFYEAAQNEKSM